MSVEVKDRQCLLDVALVATGSVEGAFGLAVANGIGLTAGLPLGTVIENAPAGVVSRRVVSVYAMERVSPAMEVSDVDMASCCAGGIGHMGIEIDFRVS